MRLPVSLHTVKDGGKSLVLDSTLWLLRIVLHDWGLLLRIVDSRQAFMAVEVSHGIVYTEVVDIRSCLKLTCTQHLLLLIPLWAGV